jgi:hypothetical protein
VVDWGSIQLDSVQVLLGKSMKIVANFVERFAVILFLFDSRSQTVT